MSDDGRGRIIFTALIVVDLETETSLIGRAPCQLGESIPEVGELVLHVVEMVDWARGPICGLLNSQSTGVVVPDLERDDKLNLLVKRASSTCKDGSASVVAGDRSCCGRSSTGSLPCPAGLYCPSMKSPPPDLSFEEPPCNRFDGSYSRLSVASEGVLDDIRPSANTFGESGKASTGPQDPYAVMSPVSLSRTS